VVGGNSVSENIKKRKKRVKWVETKRKDTRTGIQKRVSQKPYEGKLKKKPMMLPTKQDKLEKEDLEKMEEEEGIDLERWESTLVQNKGIPEDKNRKIPKSCRNSV
jgi:hypothetical protein